MTQSSKASIERAFPNEGSDQLERFRTLALRYVEIAAAEGIRVIPFLAPDMPHFQKATPEQKQHAIDFLATIVGIHEETIAGGNRAINSKKLIWRALSKLSLVPGSDVFQNFSDDDIVLIYNLEQTVTFWSLPFFRHTSLTIEQMFFCHWYNFTKRADEIHNKLYEMAVGLVSGKITGNFVPPVPGHVVEEVDTLECLKVWMELPFGSTLTQDGKLGGILIVQKMKVIE